MTEAQRSSHRLGYNVASWLSLGATPTFALMAVTTATLGNGAADMMCSATVGPVHLGGMVAMYVLMSLFHCGPWLRLAEFRRGSRVPAASAGTSPNTGASGSQLGFKTVSCLLAALCFVSPISASRAAPASSKMTPMPAGLESRFALSALPSNLRDGASVYLLDPALGYRLSRRGVSGIACLVQRTVWEMSEYRDDVYYALCYDAAGVDTYLKVIMDAAQLRAEGMPAAVLRAKVLSRFADGSYRAPTKAGLSYMVAPLMRTIGPPDMTIHTMVMPHLMFYAPGVTNGDIGAAPDLADPASLMNPFIDRQGNAEQSYMIQMVGSAQKAKILIDEKSLVRDLCAYRDILCLPAADHHM